MDSAKTTEKKGLNISTKSFIIAIVVIFCLMLLTYVLTFVIPGGEYARTLDGNGNSIIDTNGSFQYIDGGLPFWKWILSPFLVLGAEGSTTIIAVIAFLLVIGGVFNVLDKHGLMKYMLNVIINKFGEKRYKLMLIVTFFFMAMGAIVGSFEECVPMVPIVVALAIGLGWDSLTGMGMSLLAIGCGFASGVCNPFTVGVAQELAGLRMFSGIWLRAVAFAVIFIALSIFLRLHAKRVERPIDITAIGNFEKNEKAGKGLVAFVVILGLGILLVLCSPFIKAIQDYTMIIVAVTFLAAGTVSVAVAGMKAKRFFKVFLDGVVSILPAVIMILMASSIKYTLVEGKILDTILYGAVSVANTLPKAAVILFIYLIVLVMNFFIASGSAKAFLLIPLIIPIAQIFDIPAQLCVMAYAFGDGFSNVFYPTNPVLLISMGLADVDYGKWVRYSGPFQLINLILTSGILLFGLAVGYC